METSKICQDNGVPTKVLKENEHINVYFSHSSFNVSVKNSEFPWVLNQTNINPTLKKEKKNLKTITDELCMSNWILMLSVLQPLYSKIAV